MDKEKIIEAIVDKFEEYYDGYITRDYSKPAAEDILKALCKELPEPTYTTKAIDGFHQVSDNLLPCEAISNGDGLYKQLKSWGKDD